MQPIAKIASGGELSRVMLAIKTIFAQVDSVSCVVFDEIDTGLSGRVLNAVKEKMHVLSSSQQVICITHQPIIAAGADNYLQVEKSQGADKTSIRVEPLNNTNDRIKALAAMASGYDNEASALDFARSLMSRVTA
jgi:DNA repair protein RecN (Recombination protein N)